MTCTLPATLSAPGGLDGSLYEYSRSTTAYASEVSSTNPPVALNATSDTTCALGSSFRASSIACWARADSSTRVRSAARTGVPSIRGVGGVGGAGTVATAIDGGRDGGARRNTAHATAPPATTSTPTSESAMRGPIAEAATTGAT